MTIHAPIEMRDEPWPEAVTAANAWRGRCLDLFARAEAEVSETLFVLAEGSAGVDATLPHLVGSRYQALADALATPASTRFAADTAPLLQAMRERDDRRATPCQDRGRVAIDRAGRWILILRLPTFRGGKADRRDLVVDARDGTAMADDLQRRSTRLASRLQVVRRAIAAMPPAGQTPSHASESDKSPVA